MHRDTDPYGAFRFALELGAIEAASFAECTGLEVSAKLHEYREGGRNGSSLKFPEPGEVGNVTLKRGVLTGAAADVLFAWAEDVATGRFDAGANLNLRPADPSEDIVNGVAVVLQDDTGTELRRWRLYRPIPVKWSGPELKAASSDVALETLELACEGIEQVSAG